VSRAIEDTLPVSDHEPIFGFQLLNKTVEIFKTLCSGKYVSVKFIDSNLRLFKQLYHLTSPGRTEYLNKKAFDWIHRLLDRCHSQVGQPLKYFMDQCSEEVSSLIPLIVGILESTIRYNLAKNQTSCILIRL
jgi:hypothetical protein